MRGVATSETPLMLALLLLAACADPPPCSFPGEPGDDLLSPSEGATLRVPWVPLMLNIPDTYRSADVALCLDGEPWSDPLAQLEERYSWQGDGVDYIAYLDVEGLAPGPHVLEARVSKRKREPLRLRSRFTVERPPHAVTLRVAEGRAARVLVLRDGAPYPLAGPDVEATDPTGRDTGLHSVFVLGEATLHLDPGRYTFIAARSVLDDVDVVEVEVAGDREVALAVPPRVSTPGWITADLHVHTARSPDSFIPDHVRYQSLAAAGLDVAVFTDHNLSSGPPRPLSALLQELEGQRALQGVEGDLYLPDDDDADTNRESIGHLNAFPVIKGAEARFPPTTVTAMPEHLAAWRARQQAHPYEGLDTLILQLNHPRGIHFLTDPRLRRVHDFFGKLGYDRDTPLGEGVNAWTTERSADGSQTALSFDAIELLNRASWALYQEVRADWFGLLDQGLRLTATGNSDSHALELEVVGFPVNLVACPQPAEGEAVDVACLVRAIREGELKVTNGPVVSLSVREGVAELRVQAAPWVPVAEARLVVNGDVVDVVGLSEDARGADGVLDQTLQLTLPPLVADAWVLAEAGAPLGPAPAPESLGVYALLAPQHVPVGFTNPIRLDVDGDGVWTAPGM